jgi:hypothetical protein
MITATEAEALAQKTMQEYINACGCDTEQDVANVLMKLASMCGLGMIAVVGVSEAAARMQGTADHIASRTDAFTRTVEH